MESGWGGGALLFFPGLEVFPLDLSVGVMGLELWAASLMSPRTGNYQKEQD